MMMSITEFIGTCVVGITVLQCLIAGLNVLFRENLPKQFNSSHTLISILIPARNEEQTLPYLLEDLLRQRYQLFEVLVFDDESTDRTAEIVRSYASRDSRVKLFSSTGLPEGWYGKQYACHQLAKAAHGEYFLFLDADVRCREDFLERCLTFVEVRKLDLLSIFPKQEMFTVGEATVVPIMQFILLTLLPLPLVEKVSHPLVAAANGQVLLFKASTYKQLNVHERLRSVRADDIYSARLLKREGKRVSCLVGDDSIRCRMYQTYSDALQGFAKNILDMLCSSHVCAVGYVFMVSLGWIVVYSLPPLWFLVFLLCAVSSHLFVAMATRQNVLLYGLFAPLHRVHVFVLLLLHYGLRLFGRLQWKGRTLS